MNAASTAEPDSVDNLVVLRGIVTSEPTSRELASGMTVVNFDVSTGVVTDGKPQKISVPVSWHDPSDAAVAPVAVDEGVIVVGTVQRRFFRTGGSTQARTEVIVDKLLPLRRTKSVRSLVAAAAADLTRDFE